MIIKKHRLATNAMLNCLRVCSNIILPMISFPYLTRILHVNNFGKISFCTSIISYFILLSGLGISNYSIREGARIRENNEQLSQFSGEIFTIHLFSTFFTYCLLFLFLFTWKAKKDYKLIVAILSISILSNAFSFDWLPNVLEDFFFITVRVISVQVLSIVAIFLFVKKSEDYFIYTCITALTSIISGILNFLYAKKKIKICIIREFNWKTHLKPILILFANTLMITIYLQSDITMIGIFKGDHEVGLYRISVQIYSAIKTMLNAITVVTIPRLSLYLNSKKKDTYNQLVSMIIGSLLYLCIPAMFGLFLISKNCIALIGGTEYISSVLSLKILCFALIAAVFGNFFINAVLITNHQEKKAFLATVTSAIVNILLNLFFVPEFGFIGAAITTLISEIVVAGLLMYYSKKYIHIMLNFNLILLMCFETVLIILICFFISSLKLKLVLDTILKIGFSVIAYVIVTLIAKKHGFKLLE